MPDILYPYPFPDPAPFAVEPWISAGFLVIPDPGGGTIIVEVSAVVCGEQTSSASPLTAGLMASSVTASSVISADSLAQVLAQPTVQSDGSGSGGTSSVLSPQSEVRPGSTAAASTLASIFPSLSVRKESALRNSPITAVLFSLSVRQELTAQNAVSTSLATASTVRAETQSGLTSTRQYVVAPVLSAQSAAESSPRIATAYTSELRITATNQLSPVARMNLSGVTRSQSSSASTVLAGLSLTGYSQSGSLVSSMVNLQATLDVAAFVRGQSLASATPSITQSIAGVVSSGTSSYSLFVKSATVDIAGHVGSQSSAPVSMLLARASSAEVQSASSVASGVAASLRVQSAPLIQSEPRTGTPLLVRSSSGQVRTVTEPVPSLLRATLPAVAIHPATQVRSGVVALKQTGGVVSGFSSSTPQFGRAYPVGAVTQSESRAGTFTKYTTALQATTHVRSIFAASPTKRNLPAISVIQRGAATVRITIGIPSAEGMIAQDVAMIRYTAETTKGTWSASEPTRSVWRAD